MARKQYTPEEIDGYVDELSGIIKAGEDDGREMNRLKEMRAAFRTLRTEAGEAEQRGYARRDTELKAQSVFASKGIPDTAAGLFSGVDLTDTAALDTKLQELASQGIRFEKAATEGAPPAAAESSPTGGPTNVQPNPLAGVDWAQIGKHLENVPMQPGMTPEAAIAAAVGQMQATQAGGTPPASSGDTVADIKKMAANPGAYSEEQMLSLADRFNREIDALSQQASGTGILG